MRSCQRSAIAVSLFSVSLLFLSCGGSDDNGGGGGAVCKTLTSYSATTLTPLSFATDIQPILTPLTGCGLTSACHGNPGVPISSSDASKMMVLTGDSAAARTALLATSVNAPSMHNVVAGNVGASFLAYKLSGDEGLACVQAMCSSGAGTGIKKPCGDPMPGTVGMLTAANRTKILDWIALGAQP